MQVIVKTNYDGKEKIFKVFESVKNIEAYFDAVLITFIDADGNCKMQQIAMDGYTELVVR